MDIDGYDPLANDRFANDPAFIAAGYDLSGLARSSSNKWGTLISPNVFLSSYHWHPGVGNTLTFFESNDPLGPSVTRTVIGGQQIGETDVWVGILDQSLPAQFSPIPFLDDPIGNTTDYNNSPLANAEVYMVGRSDNIGSSVTNIAFGRNRIDNWWQSKTVFFNNGADSSTGPTMGAIRHLPGDSDFLQYESFLIIYDSSAPLLQDIDGTLTLVGLNWYTSNPSNPDTQIDIDPHPRTEELRDYSGFAYVGNYAADIQGIIDAFQVDATAGYLSWSATAFGGATDLAETGPSLDSDGDGLDNFTEYAFCLDPLSPVSPVPASAQSVDDGGSTFLELSFSARGDPDLQYSFRIGNDLLAWDTVNLSFTGSTWTSADPATVIVDSFSDLGGGVWQLVLRVVDPLEPGTRQLVSVGASLAP